MFPVERTSSPKSWISKGLKRETVSSALG